VHITIDAETEKALHRIETATGANATSIFHDALQVYLNWGLPHRPNAETAAVLKEAEAGHGLMAHSGLEGLFNHLDRIADEADQNHPAL